MRKIKVIVLVAFIISVTSIHSFAMSQTITTFTDEAQRINQYVKVNNSTLMPVKVLAKAVDASLTENPLTGIATLSKANIKLTFDTNFKSNLVNAFEVVGYQQPYQVNDVIYISPELVIDVFGNNFSISSLKISDNSNGAYDLSVLMLGQWRLTKRVIEQRYFDGVEDPSNYYSSEEAYDFKTNIKKTRLKRNEFAEYGEWEISESFNGITTTFGIDGYVSESFQRALYVLHAYDYTIIDNKTIVSTFNPEKSTGTVEGIDLLPLTKTYYINSSDKMTVTTLLSNEEFTKVGYENIIKEFTIINTFERVKE